MKRLETVASRRLFAAILTKRREASGKEQKWAGTLAKGIPKASQRVSNGDSFVLYDGAVAQPAVAADEDATIWTRFSEIMADIYGELLGISTIVAVTAAAVALLVRMISRNERAVAEATNWLKRIVVTWIVLNTLGFIVAYLQPLIEGGQYTAT